MGGGGGRRGVDKPIEGRVGECTNGVQWGRMDGLSGSRRGEDGWVNDGGRGEWVDR